MIEVQSGYRRAQRESYPPSRSTPVHGRQLARKAGDRQEAGGRRSGLKVASSGSACVPRVSAIQFTELHILLAAALVFALLAWPL